MNVRPMLRHLLLPSNALHHTLASQPNSYTHLGGAFYCWELRRSAGQLGNYCLAQGHTNCGMKTVCSLPRPGS